MKKFVLLIKEKEKAVTNELEYDDQMNAKMMNLRFSKLYTVYIKR